MCQNSFNQELFKDLDNFIDSLEDKSGELISILHRAQNIFGFLPHEVQLHVSRRLNIPAAKVNGVVTFYSYFSEKPRGKNVISICMGTACFVKGSDRILNRLESELGIKVGETTEDGEFTISSLRCVGACGLAPVVMVNEKVHGRATNESVEKLLKELKN